MIYGQEKFVKCLRKRYEGVKNKMNTAQIRTDLAIEAREMITKHVPHEISGIDVTTSKDDEILITRVEVKSLAAQEAIQKPMGRYITIEAQGLKYNDTELQEKVMGVLADELSQLVPLTKQKTILIVGLGNRNITPDALGPKTVERVVVSRHLKQHLAEMAKDKMHLVCAMEPGVLGITGMETAEIIQGIVHKVKPDVVVAVDALAAASSHRINTTIQLANTGIHPGSGVDNKRFGLNQETMGVPVIAIGVPTVIHAATIALDTIEVLRERASFAKYFKSLSMLSERERQLIIRQVLPETLGDLMVTPKEVDRLMDDLADVIAGGINQSLYNSFDYKNIQQYVGFS